jgi:hypothetical protein
LFFVFAFVFAVAFLLSSFAAGGGPASVFAFTVVFAVAVSRSVGLQPHENLPHKKGFSPGVFFTA